jgi:glycosyltransferase involved in cell wall biosynthesis
MAAKAVRRPIFMKFLFHSSFAHLALDPNETRVSGGAELQAALMARELVRRGHECVLVSGDHGQADDRTLQGVRSRLGGRFQTGGLTDTIRALAPSFRVIEEERPDFTFIYGWTSWLFFLLWPRWRGHTRLGFTCMLDTEVNGEFRRENPFRGALFEHGLRRADVRYAITDYEVDCFRKMGLDCTLYRPLIMPRTAPLAAEKDIDFLWIARCQPIKRPHLFLDLAEALPAARCVMISPNENAPLWQSVSERAARLPNVKFIERVPYHEVQAYYDRAHTFVNTSTWEGFANAFIQAGQGEAAILSLAVDTDRLLSRFQAGACANDDRQRFLEIAREWLRDQTKRRELQKGAARFVAEWHDNDRNVDAFLGGLPR